MRKEVGAISRFCKYFSQFLIVPFGLFLTGCSPVRNASEVSVTNADLVEVVHFHANRQCATCIALGQLAQKTIKENFSKEYAAGKIIFRQINIELSENKIIIDTFKPHGSSLFFKVIKESNVTIIEDTKALRLVNNEPEYMNYLSGKIRNYLGK